MYASCSSVTGSLSKKLELELVCIMWYLSVCAVVLFLGDVRMNACSTYCAVCKCVKVRACVCLCGLSKHVNIHAPIQAHAHACTYVYEFSRFMYAYMNFTSTRSYTHAFARTHTLSTPYNIYLCVCISQTRTNSHTSYYRLTFSSFNNLRYKSPSRAIETHAPEDPISLLGLNDFNFYSVFYS